jgi:hypothetical protein
MSGDQMGGIDRFRDASSRNAPNRICRAGQSAVAVAKRVWSTAKSTSILMIPSPVSSRPLSSRDDANEPPDDEHTDDESDESFYGKTQ